MSHIYMDMDMFGIAMNTQWSPIMPMPWIVSPIEYGAVGSVIRPPEDGENYRPVHIYRFNDIIGSV